MAGWLDGADVEGISCGTCSCGIMWCDIVLEGQDWIGTFVYGIVESCVC